MSSSMTDTSSYLFSDCVGHSSEGDASLCTRALEMMEMLGGAAAGSYQILIIRSNYALVAGE